MARRRLTRRSETRISPGAVATALLVLAAAAILFWPRGEGEGLDAVRTAGDDAVAAGGRVGGGFADGAAHALGNFGAAWTAAERVRQLEAENARLAAWRELALSLGERVERYEALLKMPPEAYGAGVDPEGAIGARLILDPGGAFRRTLLANAGADHGVRRGYIALNEYGLVGRVVSLGRRSARVLLLDDYNSRVPVMGEQSRVRAVMVGNVGSRANLDAASAVLGAPHLDFLVGATALRTGERIITSGDGGLFPRGLLVGWAEPSGDGKRWRVRLASAQRPIDYVRLAPFARPQTPEMDPAEEENSLLVAEVGGAPGAAPPPAAAPPRRRRAPEPAAQTPAPPPAAPPPVPQSARPLPPAAEASSDAVASGVPEE